MELSMKFTVRSSTAIKKFKKISSISGTGAGSRRKIFSGTGTIRSTGTLL
jgi:hypothetical protein